MSTQYAGGPILTVPVSAGGSGYTSAPTLNLSGTSLGYGATSTVNISGGAVTSVTVTAGGHLYPISGVAGTFSGGGGSGATVGTITVSGGDVNTTHTSNGTKSDLISAIQTALTNAGWTVASGGGTTNLLMSSTATTNHPNGLQMNFRFKDNGGSCVQVSLETTSGSLASTSNTSSGGNLLPTNGKVFRIIANPYQFSITVNGDFTVSREFIFGTVPYIPSVVTSATTVSAAGVMLCDSTSDTDTSARGSWRLRLDLNQNNVPNFAFIWNTTLFQNNNNVQNTNDYIQFPQLVMLLGSAAGQIASANTSQFWQPRQWAGNTYVTSDPLFTSALSFSSDEPYIRGQFWDATIVSEAYTGDTTATFDSHNWLCLTHNNTGSQGKPRGSLFIVTP